MGSLVRVLGLAMLGLTIGLTPTARAADSSDVVKIAAKGDAIAADGTQVITVTIDIDKPWHLYANPVEQDTLKSVQTAVTVLSGGKEVKAEYPAGKLVKDETVGDYRTYEGTVTIKLTIKREKDATDPVELSVKIQACTDKECNLPSKVKLKVK